MTHPLVCGKCGIPARRDDDQYLLPCACGSFTFKVLVVHATFPLFGFPIVWSAYDGQFARVLRIRLD